MATYDHSYFNKLRPNYKSRLADRSDRVFLVFGSECFKNKYDDSY
jgi:hypothetical protein